MGWRENAKKRRRRLRERLRAEGVSEEIIEQIVTETWRDEMTARYGENGLRKILRTNASKGPDDTGYEPSLGDPLLRGAARVQGITAKVVRRSQTITEFQHDRVLGSGEEKP
jgi:hypothetical protein